MKYVVLSLILAGAAGCASSGDRPRENYVYHNVTPADLEFAASRDPLKGTSATLYVNGMGCPLCATALDRQLERVPGVTGISIDLSVGIVLVSLDPKGRRPSPHEIGEAVKDAGFTLVKVTN